MPLTTPEIKERIISIRTNNDRGPIDKRPAFSLVASAVNAEFNLEGDDAHTKDSVQKIFKHAISGVPEVIKPILVTTDEYRDYFGETWTYMKAPIAATRKKVRVVVGVGDLHGNPDASIVASVADCDPDIIVIGGDSLDQKQASPHSDGIKTSRTIRDEIASVRAAIQFWLDNTRATIIVMRGNHDMWLWRKVSEVLPEWAVEFMQDPMDMMLAGLPEDRVKRSNVIWEFHHPSGHTDEFGGSEFLLPLGDAIFSHMNHTSALSGGAVVKLAKWFDTWHQPLGLPEATLLIQHHVHKVAQIEDRAGWRILVEPGMGGSLSTESYKANYQPKWNPGALGFVYFEQYLDGDWKTDRATVQIVRPKRSSRIQRDEK